jgi:hypothetical protein
MCNQNALNQRTLASETYNRNLKYVSNPIQSESYNAADQGAYWQDNRFEFCVLLEFRRPSVKWAVHIDTSSGDHDIDINMTVYEHSNAVLHLTHSCARPLAVEERRPGV